MRVTIVTREFGYCRVKAPDGLLGYVAADDIAPVTPVRATPPARRNEPGASKRRAPRAEPERPLDMSDVPAPDLPESDKKPRFRLNVNPGR